MMGQPAPNEVALFHKISALLRLAHLQLGQGAHDLSAVCSDIFRLADLELRPATASDWLDAFEACGGRWTVGPEGIAFVVQLAGCIDADAMMACRLERQLHSNPDLEAAVTALILEGSE
ncbi:hypothetical protein A0J57_18150 [Sphingobium sp. 22B]|nr:hypothetical protein AXW74_20410 [Sphingobium sp. AM]KYC30914.1 hypothetical protein A0J57_18150 [Sphingobium sp. 22B]OAP30446.1 hypothetical protein A8O16_18440 [Sphingobium sp. 20006FA]